MNLFELIIAFGSGLLVGILFFGNLRWSINHMETSRFPGLIYGASLLLRMLLVFVLAYWALKIGILILLIGLAGFTISRIVFVTRAAFAPRNGTPNVSGKALAAGSPAVPADSQLLDHSKEGASHG